MTNDANTFSGTVRIKVALPAGMSSRQPAGQYDPRKGTDKSFFFVNLQGFRLRQTAATSIQSASRSV
jgi:hypothetical protein